MSEQVIREGNFWYGNYVSVQLHEHVGNFVLNIANGYVSITKVQAQGVLTQLTALSPMEPCDLNIGSGSLSISKEENESLLAVLTAIKEAGEL